MSDLAVDVGRLERQILELEQLVAELRRAGVDAVVVGDPESVQLRTLPGSDRVYRQIVEHMREGAVTVSAEGVVLSANARFAEMVGTERADLVGRRVEALCAPTAAAALGHLLGTEPGTSASASLDLLRLDHVVLPAQVVVVAIDIDGAVVRCLLVTDVAEHRRAQERLAAQAASLAHSEAKLHLLAENSSDVVYSLDTTGTIEWVSPSARTMLGFAPDELVGHSVRDLLHPDDVAASAKTRQEMAKIGHGSIEMRVRTADDAWRWVNVTGRAVFDADGNLVGGIESLRDIDAEVRNRVALAESEEQFRLAMQGSPEGMAIVSLDRRFEQVNPALCELLGRTEEWLLAHAIPDVVHPDDVRADDEVREQLLRGEAASRVQERRMVTGEGMLRWVQHAIGLLRDPEGAPLFFVSQFQDITDRKTTEGRLQHAATHDALTGLANRAYLLDEIRRSLSSARRTGRHAAVLMVDLDHFKLINDSLGHGVGDELLQQASVRILASVRDSDLVARHGGDEFVVVMRDVDSPSEVVSIASRLVAAFRKPLAADGRQLYTTASVGIAISAAGADADQMVAQADAAMYRAKEEGRDRFSMFNDELREAVSLRLQVESGLREALAHDRLEVWWLPDVDLRTGTVGAVEALARWRHEDGVAVASEFVEVAEESGLIADIGAVVLDRALAQAAAWSAAGRSPLEVRVNLSTRQLADPSLLEGITGALGHHGVGAPAVCFEITETAMLRDSPIVERNLFALHDLGCRLAVDDFGTGFASLTYLRRFPIGLLKLDRSFVADVDTDGADRRLVGGVVRLARDLGIEVTAEGVERRSQADVLVELGCDHAQGFLFSPAVPAADLDALGRTLSPS